MKSLIFDTDVLSTFGKIRRLDLLRKLLPDATFLAPPSVYGELFKASTCLADHKIRQIFTRFLC
jgi:hypothetical protein